MLKCHWIAGTVLGYSSYGLFKLCYTNRLIAYYFIIKPIGLHELCYKTHGIAYTILYKPLHYDFLTTLGLHACNLE